MDVKRGERRASQRDYTPHEHEELRAIAKTAALGTAPGTGAIDEAYDRQNIAKTLERHGAEGYAQQMRSADTAERAIAILKTFAQSRGELLSVAHEDRPPDQMCTAHMSSGAVSNSMGAQGAAIAAIAAWLDKT